MGTGGSGHQDGGGTADEEAAAEVKRLARSERTRFELRSSPLVESQSSLLHISRNNYTCFV
uniref:Uncharacterized protein n=1 Tax=Setaria italica TaxID=4555 RepID=K3YEZ2_SETIT